MTRKGVDILPANMIRDEREALRLFDKEKHIGLDLETGGLNPMRDPLAVVILRGRETKRTAVLHVRGSLSNDLRHFLGDPGREFTGHNIAAFDLPFMKSHGVNVFGPRWWDTLVSECVIQSSARRSVSASLKASLSRRVGVNIKKDMDHSGWMNEELNDRQIEYAGGDLEYIFDLREAHEARAAEEGSTEHMLLEMDIIPAVVRMITNGIPLDVPELTTFLDGRRSQTAEIQERLDALNGGPVNLNSHVQVKKLFLEQFKVVLAGTDVDTMADLVRSTSGLLQATAADVAEWRHAKQNLKMYTDAWVRNYVLDGNVHCRFWQAGTDTLRFSSTSPNLQQVPKKMRHIFGNTPGHGVVSADFAQIEVRIAAAIAHDDALLEACAHGDPHTAIAMGVFGVTGEEVAAAKGSDMDYRRLAKAQSFRLLFGGGAKGLWEQVRSEGSEISLEEAQRQVNLFRGRYAALNSMRAKAFVLAKNRGAVVVTLPLGARRVLAGMNLTGMKLLNTAVQGAAGVGLKCALRRSVRSGTAELLSLTVHDELVAGRVPERDMREYGEQLRTDMLEGMGEITEAPLAVEVTRGRTWGKDDMNAS